VVYPIKHLSRALTAIAGLVTALLVGALALAGTAAAEPPGSGTTEAVVGVSVSIPPAEEASPVEVPVEEITEPASEEVASVDPEPADTAAASVDSASAGPVESTVSAISSSVGSSDSTPTSSTAEAVEQVSSTVAGAAGQASDPVEAVSRAAAEARTAPIAERAVRSVVPSGSLSNATAPIREAVRVPAGEVLNIVAAALSTVPSLSRELLSPQELLPPLETVLTSAPTGAGHPPLTDGAPSFSIRELAGPIDASERFAASPGGLPVEYLSAFGGLEPSASAVMNHLASAPAASPMMSGASQFRSGSTSGSSHDSPLDLPAPPFGAPDITAGSGSSIFIPLAALLALLALAVPATLRRLGAVPDALAPVPFVCALERPG
jgi:hypothetical protein